MDSTIDDNGISSDSDEIPDSGQESGGHTDRSHTSPPTDNPGRLDTSSMSASSLFAHLFTNSGNALGLLGPPPEGDAKDPS